MLQLKHSSCAANPDAKGDDLNSRNIIKKFPWNIENLYIKTNSLILSPHLPFYSPVSKYACTKNWQLKIQQSKRQADWKKKSVSSLKASLLPFSYSVYDLAHYHEDPDPIYKHFCRNGSFWSSIMAAS